MQSFLDQVLRDGLYHADPHPGNIFVDPSGGLWFLDFGAVGRLSPLVLESLQEMAIGFQLNDPVVLARATSHLAGGDEGGDSRALEADIGLVLSEGLGSGSFDPQAMSLMLEVMQRHGLEVPSAMTVLSRALLTLEGTLRTIDPSFNIAHEATALLPELADQKSDMLQQQLEKEVIRALPSLRTLPTNVEAIATQLRRGRLSMRVERFGGADREVVDEWVDRIVVRRARIARHDRVRGPARRRGADPDRRRLRHRAPGDRFLRHHRDVGDPDARGRPDPPPR